MVDRIIFYLLYLTFNCDCQVPINGRFTDQFGQRSDRFRVLTEETNRRILEQFKAQPIPETPSAIRGRNTIDFVQSDPASLFSVIQADFGRLGMRNVDFITHPPLPLLAGKHLGNFRSTDLLQRQQNELTPVWNNNLRPVDNNAQSTNLNSNPIFQGTDLRQRNNIVSSPNKAENDPNIQEVVPIMPSGNNQRNINMINIPSMLSSGSDNLDLSVSEAELLQMRPNALEGIGNHGIALDSVVDLNVGIQQLEPSRGNSSTEEQLILALLERLIAIKESQRQGQRNPFSNAIIANSDTPAQGIRNNPGNQLPVQSFDIPLDTSLARQTFANQLPVLNLDVPRSASVRQQSSSNQVQIQDDRRVDNSRQVFQFQPAESIACQLRGCPSGSYCVTVGLSDLFSEFCHHDSIEPCKCARGCNFQSRFLPENAVERVGSCRKCVCERNGEIYCSLTRRCRRMYRLSREGLLRPRF